MALRKGFSLIELVIVIGLISILALAISSIMLTSIVTSNRVRTLTKTKQAGNYALIQLKAMIRSSKSIISCDEEIATLEIVGLDGGVTTLATESDGENIRIASNSGYYLTPGSTTVSSYTLGCEPNESEPTLIRVSFDLTDTSSTRESENSLLHFETSINLRNN